MQINVVVNIQCFLIVAVVFLFESFHFFCGFILHVCPFRTETLHVFISVVFLRLTPIIHKLSPVLFLPQTKLHSLFFHVSVLEMRRCVGA